jgi:hypothetical protein
MLNHLNEAQKIAKSDFGVKNISQPGVLREIIIAYKLGHNIDTAKHGPDATDTNENKYEYLSCLDGGSFQMDRMFKEPKNMRIQSLKRIKRNTCFYFVIFNKNNPLNIKEIYKVSTKDALKEAKRQLDISRNKISHISFGKKWTKKSGKKLDI